LGTRGNFVADREETRREQRGTLEGKKSSQGAEGIDGVAAQRSVWGGRGGGNSQLKAKIVRQTQRENDKQPGQSV